MATKRPTQLSHGRHPLRSNSPKRNSLLDEHNEYSKDLFKGKDSGSSVLKAAFTPDSNVHRSKIAAITQQIRPQVQNIRYLYL